MSQPTSSPGTSTSPPAAELLDQSRWNDDYGKAALKELEDRPEQFTIAAEEMPEHKRILIDSLPDVRGMRVLDFGSGQGELSVAMAQRGAIVTGIDIGTELVELASKLAEINNVDCEFIVGSIHELPFEDGTYDCVVGVGILHHLPELAASRSFAEAHRVLRPGGLALFVEPLENSRVFDLLQSLIPVGSPGDSQYRPSILQRTKWKAFLQTLDERQLTDAELKRAAVQFTAMHTRYHGWLARLTRIIPGSAFAQFCEKVDPWLCHPRSPVKRYSRQVFVEFRK